MLKVLKLTAVLEEVAEGIRMRGHDRGGSDKRQLHQKLILVISNALAK